MAGPLRSAWRASCSQRPCNCPRPRSRRACTRKAACLSAFAAAAPLGGQAGGQTEHGPILQIDPVEAAYQFSNAGLTADHLSDRLLQQGTQQAGAGPTFALLDGL